jgi:hypothetical protein
MTMVRGLPYSGMQHHDLVEGLEECTASILKAQEEEPSN